MTSQTSLIAHNVQMAAAWGVQCSRLDNQLQSRPATPRDADRIQDCLGNCQFFVTDAERCANDGEYPADVDALALVSEARAVLQTTSDIASRYSVLAAAV